ncbi:hypothetical protein OG258_54545 [Streptomyces mirabilis]|uniref:hypothetical protein n=1 Tax=Streptomyces mirabilis TaxID=68239 RepID=UPI002E2C0571|nr:hypothetical protein [Streptomyces mirabilis]
MNAGDRSAARRPPGQPDDSAADESPNPGGGTGAPPLVWCQEQDIRPGLVHPLGPAPPACAHPGFRARPHGGINRAARTEDQ